MKNLIITIHESDNEEGYIYDIFETEDDMLEGNSLDGGLCTTTMQNALDMATEQAKAILNK